ncbi:MAG: hypothetical protein K8R31_12065 [Bacteroidales bacterium]|nr:hypothetical protein [Bacteroidales bacterium]
MRNINTRIMAIILVTGFILNISCQKDENDSASTKGMLKGKYTIFEGEMLHEEISINIEIYGDKVNGQVTAPLLNLQNTDFAGTVIKEVNQYGVLKWYTLEFKADNSDFFFNLDIEELEINTSNLYEGHIYKDDVHVGGFYSIPDGIDTLEVIDYHKLSIRPCRYIDKINGNYFVLNFTDSLTVYDETWNLISKQDLRGIYQYVQITHDENNIFLVSQSCIYRYNTELELQDSIIVDGMIGACTVYNNSLWIQKRATTEILNMSFDGTVLSTFESPVTYPLHALIVNDYIYIVDETYPRGLIKKMTLSGELITTYSTFEVNWSTEGSLTQMDGNIYYLCAGRGLLYQVKL